MTTRSFYHHQVSGVIHLLLSKAKKHLCYNNLPSSFSNCKSSRALAATDNSSCCSNSCLYNHMCPTPSETAHLGNDTQRRPKASAIKVSFSSSLSLELGRAAACFPTRLVAWNLALLQPSAQNLSFDYRNGPHSGQNKKGKLGRNLPLDRLRAKCRPSHRQQRERRRGEGEQGGARLIGAHGDKEPYVNGYRFVLPYCSKQTNHFLLWKTAVLDPLEPG